MCTDHRGDDRFQDAGDLRIGPEREHVILSGNRGNVLFEEPGPPIQRVPHFLIWMRLPIHRQGVQGSRMPEHVVSRTWGDVGVQIHPIDKLSIRAACPDEIIG